MPHLPRRASLLAATAFLAGCQSWHTEPLPTPRDSARVVRGHVRATRADGSSIELAGVRVAGDTLRGTVWATRRSAEPRAVALPVDSVPRLEARRVSVGRTAALTGGLLAVYVLIAVAVAENQILTGWQ
jgi:hypothetical protein